MNSRQTAVITGTSQGLGFALAKELASRDWRLVIDARTTSELEDAARALSPFTEIHAIPGDVADAEHRQALIGAAGDHIDLLVNNASLLGPSPQPALESYPLEELDDVFRVNVIAPLALIQLALPRMGGGCVINVTSDAAVQPYPGWGGYGASKAALDQLSAVLGAEHPDLRVYAADPGDMQTRMHRQAFPGEDISDRPPPEESVPGLLALIEGALPSGRYLARELSEVVR
jgi:NAD(P)-dependent dehydrogenase (short-subunit alcohol dehydrogenase family)